MRIRFGWLAAMTGILAMGLVACGSDDGTSDPGMPDAWIADGPGPDAEGAGVDGPAAEVPTLDEATLDNPAPDATGGDLPAADGLEGDEAPADAPADEAAPDIGGEAETAEAFVPSGPCDQNLALDDQNAVDGARAIELCDLVTAQDGLPGLISAGYVRANGQAFNNPGAQVGVLSGFGPNVFPQEGSRLLVLSTGRARTPGQADACGSESCAGVGAGTPPPGFPLETANCPTVASIFDDVGLELKLRAPGNATGFSFRFAFYTFNLPDWVCTAYDDAFVAIMSPAPEGSVSGNIAWSGNQRPVNAQAATQACDPSTLSSWASSCAGSGQACPTAPSPYCPLGTGQLVGTGFDSYAPPAGGSTGWLTASAPVVGGSTFTLRLAVWDSGDANFDSTVLIDAFAWTF